MFKFPIAYLNSNDGSGLLAFGEGSKLTVFKNNDVTPINSFLEENKGNFIFGYIGYDMKNGIEKLSSSLPDSKGFPDVFLWVPDAVVKLDGENFRFLQGEKKPEHFEFLNY